LAGHGVPEAFVRGLATRSGSPAGSCVRGSVVNVSSVVGSRVVPPRIAYGTSKAALDQLTRSLAVEWGPDGIRVNAVLPTPPRRTHHAN
jgi:NAD(P)-dependent dehydrogenase (short-subunit alcohol dehydrogenase family)